MINLRDPKIFEAEVRRIARAIWPSDTYSGPIMLDGLERDAIFITEDNVIYIEATTAKDEAKARKDIGKLEAGVAKLRQKFPDHSVRGIFVTLDDPTGHQGVVVTNAHPSVRHSTFDQLRARLIDARKYLEARSDYPFGSARDPRNNAPDISADEFIDVSLFVNDDPKPKESADIARSIQGGGKKYLILGDFGVGKSMLLKHIFLFLKRQNFANVDHKFPVLLNLRDHREQNEPAEALHRHAKKIGFEQPNQLVRAWRAGYVHLILDGFDELPPRTTAQETSKIKDIRRNSVELVRQFANNSRSDASIVVAGRTNFFGSEAELDTALGTKNWRRIELGEWSDEDLSEFLTRKKYSGLLPKWLPRRPLLVGSLISRGFLKGSSKVLTVEKAEGWSHLMRHIYDREANQMEIGIDGPTLLQVAARVASQARTKSSRQGPVNFTEIKTAYEEVARGTPEDRAINALLRLPGLQGRTTNVIDSDVIAANTPANSSEFFDEEYADVLSAFDIAEYISNPYQNIPTYWSALQHPLGDTGVEVGAHILKEKKISPGVATSALIRLNDTNANSLGNVDIVNITKQAPLKITKSGVVITGIHLPIIRFEHGDSDMSQITFRDCYFDTAIFMTDESKLLPNFVECLFGDLKTWFAKEETAPCLRHCQFETYSILEDGTQDAGSDLPVNIVVLVNVLKKLYLQSVKGRRETALPKGLSPKEQQSLPDVLEALRHSNGAERRMLRGSAVWHPVRGFSEAATMIVRRPRPDVHPLVKELWVGGE
ncbi:MAG: NACHT domain-containing protein [Hyphomicrobiaceae bacterium]|nr:NACHT domain-containing protein [Hyphomicrobiaceae bacterium]